MLFKSCRFFCQFSQKGECLRIKHYAMSEDKATDDSVKNAKVQHRLPIFPAPAYNRHGQKTSLKPQRSQRLHDGGDREEESSMTWEESLMSGDDYLKTVNLKRHKVLRKKERHDGKRAVETTGEKVLKSSHIIDTVMPDIKSDGEREKRENNKLRDEQNECGVLRKKNEKPASREIAVGKKTLTSDVARPSGDTFVTKTFDAPVSKTEESKKFTDKKLPNFDKARPSGDTLVTKTSDTAISKTGKDNLKSIAEKKDGSAVRHTRHKPTLKRTPRHQTTKALVDSTPMTTSYRRTSPNAERTDLGRVELGDKCEELERKSNGCQDETPQTREMEEKNGQNRVDTKQASLQDTDVKKIGMEKRETVEGARDSKDAKQSKNAKNVISPSSRKLRVPTKRGQRLTPDPTEMIISETGARTKSEASCGKITSPNYVAKSVPNMKVSVTAEMGSTGQQSRELAEKESTVSIMPTLGQSSTPVLVAGPNNTTVATVSGSTRNRLQSPTLFGKQPTISVVLSIGQSSKAPVSAAEQTITTVAAVPGSTGNRLQAGTVVGQQSTVSTEQSSKTSLSAEKTITTNAPTITGNGQQAATQVGQQSVSIGQSCKTSAEQTITSVGGVPSFTANRPQTTNTVKQQSQLRQAIHQGPGLTNLPLRVSILSPQGDQVLNVPITSLQLNPRHIVTRPMLGPLHGVQPASVPPHSMIRARPPTVSLFSPQYQMPAPMAPNTEPALTNIANHIQALRPQVIVSNSNPTHTIITITPSFTRNTPGIVSNSMIKQPRPSRPAYTGVAQTGTSIALPMAQVRRTVSSTIQRNGTITTPTTRGSLMKSYQQQGEDNQRQVAVTKPCIPSTMVSIPAQETRTCQPPCTKTNEQTSLQKSESVPVPLNITCGPTAPQTRQSATCLSPGVSGKLFKSKSPSSSYVAIQTSGKMVTSSNNGQSSGQAAISNSCSTEVTGTMISTGHVDTKMESTPRTQASKTMTNSTRMDTVQAWSTAVPTGDDMQPLDLTVKNRARAAPVEKADDEEVKDTPSPQEKRPKEDVPLIDSIPVISRHPEMGINIHQDYRGAILFVRNKKVIRRVPAGTREVRIEDGDISVQFQLQKADSRTEEHHPNSSSQPEGEGKSVGRHSNVTQDETGDLSSIENSNKGELTEFGMENMSRENDDNGEDEAPGNTTPLVITLKKNVRSGEMIPGTKGKLADVSMYTVVQKNPSYEHRKVTRNTSDSSDGLMTISDGISEGVLSMSGDLSGGLLSTSGGTTDGERNEDGSTGARILEDKSDHSSRGRDGTKLLDLSLIGDEVRMNWSPDMPASSSPEPEEEWVIDDTSSASDIFITTPKESLSPGWKTEGFDSLLIRGRSIPFSEHPPRLMRFDEEDSCDDDFQHETSIHLEDEMGEIAPYEELSGEVIDDLVVEGQAVSSLPARLTVDEDGEGGVPDECYEEDLVRGDTFLGEAELEIKGKNIKASHPGDHSLCQTESFGFISGTVPDERSVYDEIYVEDFDTMTDSQVDSGNGTLQIIGRHVNVRQHSLKLQEEEELRSETALEKDARTLREILMNSSVECKKMSHEGFLLTEDAERFLKKVEYESMGSRDGLAEIGRCLSDIFLAHHTLLKVTIPAGKEVPQRKEFISLQRFVYDSIQVNIDFIRKATDMIRELVDVPQKENSSVCVNETRNDWTPTGMVTSPGNSLDSLYMSMELKRKRFMLSSDSSDSSYSHSKSLSMCEKAVASFTSGRFRQRIKRVCQVPAIPSRSDDWRHLGGPKTSTPKRDHTEESEKDMGSSGEVQANDLRRTEAKTSVSCSREEDLVRSEHCAMTGLCSSPDPETHKQAFVRHGTGECCSTEHVTDKVEVDSFSLDKKHNIENRRNGTRATCSDVSAGVDIDLGVVRDRPSMEKVPEGDSIDPDESLAVETKTEEADMVKSVELPKYQSQNDRKYSSSTQTSDSVTMSPLRVASSPSVASEAGIADRCRCNVITPALKECPMTHLCSVCKPRSPCVKTSQHLHSGDKVLDLKSPEAWRNMFNEKGCRKLPDYDPYRLRDGCSAHRPAMLAGSNPEAGSKNVHDTYDSKQKKLDERTKQTKEIVTSVSKDNSNQSDAHSWTLSKLASLHTEGMSPSPHWKVRAAISDYSDIMASVKRACSQGKSDGDGKETGGSDFSDDDCQSRSKKDRHLRATRRSRRSRDASPEVVTPSGRRRGFKQALVCKKIVNEIWNMEESDPFAFERKRKHELPADYFEVIRRPMWLEWILRKLGDRTYNNLREFVHDMKRIFWNCHQYNKPGSKIVAGCEKLEEVFDGLLLHHFPEQYEHLTAITGDPKECQQESIKQSSDGEHDSPTTEDAIP